MNIGVVIPTHNLGEKLQKAIHCLFASRTKHGITLCVIDNNSEGTGIYERCRRSAHWDNSIYYVRIPWNAHFARACNTGIHVLGQVDAFLFLNNDCYLDPDCLNHMVQALRLGAGSIIGARLRYPDGTIQHAGGDIVGDWQAVTHMHRGLPFNDPEVLISEKVPWVTAACMLVHARSFVENGGFVEHFQNGYEDVDLCLRFRVKGIKTYYCAEATAVHEEAQTPGRKDKEAENAEIFFNRWKKENVENFLY